MGVCKDSEKSTTTSGAIVYKSKYRVIILVYGLYGMFLHVGQLTAPKER